MLCFVIQSHHWCTLMLKLKIYTTMMNNDSILYDRIYFSCNRWNYLYSIKALAPIPKPHNIPLLSSCVRMNRFWIQRQSSVRINTIWNKFTSHPWNEEIRDNRRMQTWSILHRQTNDLYSWYQRATIFYETNE